MSVSKDRQAGSATSFVIVAIILIAVTIGGIAYVVQRGDQVRKDAEASKIAEQEAEQKAKDAEAAKNAAKDKPVATNTNTTSPSSTATNNLPATGTEMDVVRIVAIALLSYVATSFILSHRGFNKRSL
jgi:dihydroxyacid dehydratase/phosphogluconate dehydratase